MIHTVCPIDGTDDADVEVYRARFDPDRLTPAMFSARREPERLHYRMVRNLRTGCLRADPILDEDALAGLYRRSAVIDRATATRAADVYLRYAAPIWSWLPDRRGALEVGCGHGAFLAHLVGRGFAHVTGVEPSRDAVAQADPLIRPMIREGGMRAGLVPDGSCSLVCGFQVLDHLAEPNDVLRACRDALAPGGLMYWICHDIGFPLSRWLGERSPLIDIEHVVLYDRRTIRRLFEKHGFEVLRVFGVANDYPIDYWLHLAPFGGRFKAACAAFLRASRLGRVHANLNLGNMGIIARKPRQG